MKIRVKFWQLQRSRTNKQLALYGISCSQQNANAGMLCKQVNYQIAKANFAECCFQLVVVCRKVLFVFVCVHLRGFKIKIIVECCTRLVYVCAMNVLQQIQRNIDYQTTYFIIFCWPLMPPSIIWQGRLHLKMGWQMSLMSDMM